MSDLATRGAYFGSSASYFDLPPHRVAMDKLDLGSAPNPFSAFADAENRSRQNLRSAARLLGISIALFCLVVAGQHLWTDAGLDRWLAAGANAPTEAMLEQIAGSGELELSEIESVVAVIGSDDASRSLLGYQAVEAARKGWVTLRTEQRQQHRHVLALALQHTSNSKQFPQSDPRQQRMVKLADAIAQEVLADANLSESTSPLSPPDSETFDIAMRLVTDSDRLTDQFAETTPDLPTESYVAQQSWTDWPPEPLSAPKLVRPQIGSLEESSNVPQLLAQTAATMPLPPSLQDIDAGPVVAATLDELPEQPRLTAQQWIEYWAGQLKSRSILVRMRAINELGKHAGPEVIARLQAHLPHESDPKVAHRIRQQLNLVGR